MHTNLAILVDGLVQFAVSSAEEIEIRSY